MKKKEFIPIVSNYKPFVLAISGRKPIITPDEFTKDQISKIIVGPACGFIEARTAVRKLLLKNDFDPDAIEIIHANFPFQTI